MQTTILTKENVETIPLELGKPSNFHNYQMFFLQVPIVYNFKKPVTLKKSRFSLIISNISKKDKKILGNLIARLDSAIVFDDTIFINYKEHENNIYDRNNDQAEYMIQVEIKGCKHSMNNVGLIWKTVKIEKKI